jgi:vacuolar-type H+-ATPase subunit D/Vma8
MTNEVADQMATEFLNIEQQRNELKRRYYSKFKSALDALTATRFLQVENQIERIVDLQIASQLPVMQGSRGEAQ